LRSGIDTGDSIIDDYDSYNNYTSSDVALQTALLVWGVALVAIVVIAVLSYLLIAIPLSALFRKTGVEPWKAWIPVYSTYTWLRLGGQNGNWAWFSFVPYGSIVSSIFLYIGMHRTGKAFGKDTGFLVLGIFLPWVWLFILGFGRDPYRPELIAAAGLGAPYVGTGAVPAEQRFGPPQQYTALPYQQDQQPYQQQPQPTEQPPTEQPPTDQPPRA
jgi:hypothetical protein